MRPRRRLVGFATSTRPGCWRARGGSSVRGRDDHRGTGEDQRMTRRAVSTSAAPGAAGPYSQAIEAGDFVFCAGQIGRDQASGSMPDTIEAQTEQVLRNLEAVLDAAGCTFGDVVKTTCFLADIND